jgi:hypothetical protein
LILREGSDQVLERRLLVRERILPLVLLLLKLVLKLVLKLLVLVLVLVLQLLLLQVLLVFLLPLLLLPLLASIQQLGLFTELKFFTRRLPALLLCVR